MATLSGTSGETYTATYLNTYPYDPLPADTKCIRLLQLHAGIDSDEVHLELMPGHFDLSTNTSGSYEALSYVWGSKDDTVSVKFGPDGQDSFFITENLSMALRHLRDPEEPRTLWIDAICINQSDLAERSTQVAIMGEIFQKAGHVIAWVGLERDNSDRALEILEEIGSQIKVNSTTMEITPLFENSTLGDRTKPLPYSGDELESVHRFIWRPWFERVWVRQEIARARSSILRAGMRSIHWEYFKNAIFCMYTKWSIIGERVNLVYWMCYCHTYQLEFLRADLRHTRCEDPRDRIYGVLSLLHSDDRKLGIIPDYSNSVKDTYRDIIVKKISAAKQLNILLGCDFEETRLHHLPSWVTDFSTNSPFYELLSPNCGADLFASEATYCGNDVLRVSGLSFSTVSQILQQPSLRWEDTWSGLRSLWTKLGFDKDPDRRDGTGGPFIDALCRVMFRNRFIETFQQPTASILSFSATKQNLIALMTAPSDLSPALKRFAQKLNMYMHGRSLLVTEKGHVGLGSSKTQCGDVVCILIGSQMPFVLRSTSNGQHHLIGSCFVDGIMLAEPLLGPLPQNIRQMSKKHASEAYCWVDTETNNVLTVDPRLTALGSPFDSPHWRRPVISKEAWKRAGVDIETFDLI